LLHFFVRSTFVSRAMSGFAVALGAALTWLSPAPPLAADELPRTRWQILPLAALFYSDTTGGHVVTAAFDMPCGATPLGAVLVDRGQKLQVAAMVTRPLAACARLPERRYFNLPFLDTTAWKLIEPLRGDLDAIRVTELNVTSVNGPGTGEGTALSVDVPCGVVPAGMLVTPDPVRRSPMAFQVAAIGFKMAPRRVAATCGTQESTREAPSAASTRSVVRVGGLSRKSAYRVMPRKVGDLRKLGVLQLRGIDSLDAGRRVVSFKHRCYEVPVGLAIVPDRGGRAVAVAVASYINAPCVTRNENVARLPWISGEIAIPSLDVRVISPREIQKYRLGQMSLARGNSGDISGVVLTADSPAAAPGKSLPQGWFAFTARSASDDGRMALRSAGISGKPAPTISHGRPLRLQITSAL